MKRPEIAVVPATGSQDAYEVTVRHGGSTSSHRVTWDEWASGKAAGFGCRPEALVEACFRFLLDREAKESILPRFSLGVISRYFPEVDARIGDYLG